MKRKEQIKLLEEIYEAFNHPVCGPDGPTAKVIVPRKSIPQLLALLASEIAIQRKVGLSDKEA